MKDCNCKVEKHENGKSEIVYCENLTNCKKEIFKTIYIPKELAGNTPKNESNDMFQWCYNYIQKQKDSDEKTAIISELKNRGCL